MGYSVYNNVGNLAVIMNRRVSLMLFCVSLSGCISIGNPDLANDQKMRISKSGR